MHALLDRAIELLLELGAPSTCVACERQVRAAVCADCERERRPAPARELDGVPVIAALAYAPPFDRTIQRFKYESRPDLARGLARLLAPHVELDAELLIPVPLHPRRLAERGYNQAALLARALSRSISVPVAARALVRIRDTARQAMLDREQRLANVAHAFRAPRPSALGGRRVVLVDDVVTTGATLRACIGVLRGAGAQVCGVLAPAVTER